MNNLDGQTFQKAGTDIPLVSIVIPAYNHAAYLDEAIRSVLAQDYQYIELIVLDDGSTDETQSVLEKYTGQFHWETHKNLGQAGTLNKGWTMAKGDILAYLSADDVLLPHAVSTSVKQLSIHPEAVLCYCDFQLIDPNSKVVRNVSAPEYSYQEMVWKFVCAPGPGAFFRRRGFIEAGGWDPKFRQSPDYEYWLRLGLFGTFLHIGERLAAFRVHEGSQSFAQTTVERAEEPLRIIQKYYARADVPLDIVVEKERSFANAHFVVAQLHLRSGRYGEFFRQAVMGTVTSPRSLSSPRIVRMLMNGLFNRLLHKLLWMSKMVMDSLFSRKGMKQGE